MIVHTHVDANYLLKALQGYQSKGISVYAISIQVRPLRSPTLLALKISFHI